MWGRESNPIGAAHSLRPCSRTSDPRCRQATSPNYGRRFVRTIVTHSTVRLLATRYNFARLRDDHLAQSNHDYRVEMLFSFLLPLEHSVRNVVRDVWPWLDEVPDDPCRLPDVLSLIECHFHATYSYHGRTGG